MKTLIRKISDSFLEEAKNSPQLLEDMAAMEKYLSESYSNRIFVELLQNADDCGSTKIVFSRDSKDLIFANNGRPFNERDIIAICRSGASSKVKGESIGFRGVGFKSTTYLSKEIVIISNNVSFSFSKSICAKTLGKDIEKVPTARIPFLVEYSPSAYVKKLQKEGFTTIFVFRDAKLDEFSAEFEEISDGYFLFLRNIESCIVSIDKLNYECKLSRMPHKLGELIQNLKSKKTWLNISQDNITISFLYENGIIQECPKSEALYHCYLPTYDNTPFPFKINCDFSTDPSRKHITQDSSSNKALVSVAKLLVTILSKALNGNDNVIFKNILYILKTPSSFSSMNLELQKKIDEEIKKSLIISLSSGESIHITDYKLLPDWLEESEKQYIREHSDYVKSHSLPVSMFRQIVNLESFIGEYSTEEYSISDWIDIMKESEFIDSLTNETYSVIFSKIIEKMRLEKSISGKVYDLRPILLKTNQGIASIQEISNDKNLQIDNDLKINLSEKISQNSLEMFCDECNIALQQISDQPVNSQENDNYLGLDVKDDVNDLDDMDDSHADVNVIKPNIRQQSFKPKLHKWKTAESQCVEFEEYLGNEAINVSDQNMGYDIESTTPEGETKYIEVKSLGEGMASFSLTNNEYSSASNLGERYYLCLICIGRKSSKIIYIKDPVHTLKLTKRVKAWEWFCDDFKGEVYTLENN